AWQSEALLGPGLPSSFALQQDMLVVGGAQVTTYVRTGTTWAPEAASVPASGTAVALSGDTLLVSGTPASAYIRNNGAWVQQGTLAGDQPGETIFGVALDGDVAAVAGFARPGMLTLAYVHFYHRSGDTWTLEDTIGAGDGLSVPPVLVAVSGQTVLAVT